jgi:isoleucyl-tRNA synthetase
VAGAIAGLAPEEVRRVQAGESLRLEVVGETVEVGPQDMTVLEEASGDLTVQAAEGYLVGLDTTLTPELETEGLAREIVSRVQRLRRDSGLDVADRIRLGVASDGRAGAAAREHGDYIAGETLALRITHDAREAAALPHVSRVDIDGEEVVLGLSREAWPGAEADHSDTGR